MPDDGDTVRAALRQCPGGDNAECLRARGVHRAPCAEGQKECPVSGYGTLYTQRGCAYPVNGVYMHGKL